MLKKSLIRYTYNCQYKVFARCLSDKPSDHNEIKDETPSQNQKKKSSDSNLQKIQELLKSMSAAPKITESEYKQKFVTAPEIPRRRKQKPDVEVKTERIEESITKAAEEVAQAIGGDVKQTESELLSKVLGKINQTSTTLSDLLIGMKVDRTKKGDDLAKKETRGQQVRRHVERSRVETQNVRYIQRKTQPQRRESQSLPQPTTVNVFGGEPLGIFKASDTNFGTKLEMWESLKQRELTLATAQPPANYFEKMIVWTNQGKIWKFPIDNEQGMEKEQKVHFSDHIFLEAHLEGWCPKKGPIRHFMELVCVGLSKNPFYTAKEKKDHIIWYKKYFESKKDILTEVGVWGNVKSDNSEASV